MGYKRVDRFNLVKPNDLSLNYRQVAEANTILGQHASIFERVFRKPLHAYHIVYVRMKNNEMVTDDMGCVKLYLSQTEALKKAQRKEVIVDFMHDEICYCLAAARYYTGVNSFEIDFPDWVKSKYSCKKFDLNEALKYSDAELDEIDPPGIEYVPSAYLSDYDFKHGFLKNVDTDEPTVLVKSTESKITQQKLSTDDEIPF